MCLATSRVFRTGFKWVRGDKKAYLQVINFTLKVVCLIHWSMKIIHIRYCYNNYVSWSVKHNSSLSLFQMLQQVEQFLTVFTSVRATDTYRFYSVQHQMISLVNVPSGTCPQWHLWE